MGAPFVGTAAWHAMQLLSIIDFTSLLYVAEPAGAGVPFGAEGSSLVHPAKIKADDKRADSFFRFIITGFLVYKAEMVSSLKCAFGIYTLKFTLQILRRTFFIYLSPDDGFY
jgi:hypothetical protein